MAKLSNGVKTLPKISTGWVGCTNVTDRRQTDGRATAYSEHEQISESDREFTFTNNVENN